MYKNTATLAAEAARMGVSLREAQAQACDAGHVPVRYARNANTVSPAEQACLLRATVLLVGLGGLGGCLLEMLARCGIGHIIGVDGDSFEESNTNRQFLATEATLGQSKTQAAVERVELVNPAIYFEPVKTFLHGQDFAPLTAKVDIVADALGGLNDRAALYAAAATAGKCVVGAGIAGLTGWVAVARPGEPNPVQALWGADFLHSAEEKMGNLAPAVSLAASLQCVEIIHILLDTANTRASKKYTKKGLRGMLLFDMQTYSMTKVTTGQAGH